MGLLDNIAATAGAATNLTPIGAVLNIGKTLIDRFIPDPALAAQAQMELAHMASDKAMAELNASTQLALAQAATNNIEAASTRLYVSGWRPNIGWICGAGMAVHFVVGPMVEWTAALCGHPVKFPTMDMAELMPLVIAMLGLGGMRSYEKAKGVA